VVQVDLGSRGHKHQSLHDLGAMAVELLAVAHRRLTGEPGPDLAVLDRLARDRAWVEREVATAERPPAVTVPGYPPAG
jgi:glucosyl-3-phosphoglycerate synthase